MRAVAGDMRAFRLVATVVEGPPKRRRDPKVDVPVET
jgi:hypothetical protein